MNRPVRLGLVLVAGAHGAELDYLERLAVLPDPLLPEEDAPAAVEERQHRAEQDDRTEQDERHGGQHEVGGPLDRPARPGERGVPDLHDRDRADVVGHPAG
jgi:hypothetical protein